jgi:hypothetical protein
MPSTKYQEISNPSKCKEISRPSTKYYEISNPSIKYKEISMPQTKSQKTIIFHLGESLKI